LAKFGLTKHKTMGRKVAFMFRCGNREGLTESDPIMYPVTIVGQLDHLRTLKYSDVQNKLKPRVSKELVSLIKETQFRADLSTGERKLIYYNFNSSLKPPWMP